MTDRVPNEDLSKMQNFCDTGMHENSIILTCNQVFLFSTRKLAYLRLLNKNIQPLTWRIDILAFNANFSGEQSYLVLARKAYRPEDLGAIISF